MNFFLIIRYPIIVGISIKRVTPLEKGGARVFIDIDGEDYALLKPSSRGLITGLKKGLRVTENRGREIVADTKATADSIKAKTVVIFRVDGAEGDTRMRFEPASVLANLNAPTLVTCTRKRAEARYPQGGS